MSEITTKLAKLLKLNQTELNSKKVSWPTNVSQSQTPPYWECDRSVIIAAARSLASLLLPLPVIKGTRPWRRSELLRTSIEYARQTYGEPGRRFNQLPKSISDRTVKRGHLEYCQNNTDSMEFQKQFRKTFLIICYTDLCQLLSISLQTSFQSESSKNISLLWSIFGAHFR